MGHLSSRVRPRRPSSRALGGGEVGLYLGTAVFLPIFFAGVLCFGPGLMRRVAPSTEPSRPPTISISCNGTDIRRVIVQIAEQSDANIVISPGVSGPVTLQFKDRPWPDALRAVAGARGYLVVKVREDLYRVVSRDGLGALKTRRFPLKYINPPIDWTPTVTIRTIFPEFRKPEIRFRLYGKVEQFLSSRGKVEFVESDNSFIVTDTPAKLNGIFRIIAEFDRPNP